MNITEKIAPIQLLRGSHEDTAKTGQGCFMNVIAYLNGEPQITDASECVCVVVRPIAIFLNDFLNEDERHLLIPFIERAMGSRTNEKIELVRRANLVVGFANIAAESAKYAKYAAEYAESAKYAAKYAAESAEYAAEYAKYAKYAEYAAEYAAESAKYAAKYAEFRKIIIAAAFDFLDKALPKATEPSPEVICRAEKLVALAS